MEVKKIYLVFLMIIILLLIVIPPSNTNAATPGTLKWAYETGNGVRSSPAIASDGTIYVGSGDHKIYAIYGNTEGLADTPWSMFHHDLRHTGNIAGQFEPPIPGIKANGSDTPITITPSDNLSITIEFSSGDPTGDNANWWLVAATPFGWFHYEVESNSWAPDIKYSFQGPLFNLAEFNVLNTPLPAGTYTIYFGVDTVVNGTLDLDQAHYDYITVNIE